MYTVKKEMRSSMEIERKFLIKQLPDNIQTYPYHLIEQAYLNSDPVIRIRKEDDNYYLTYKGRGLMAREEYNLPLNEHSYLHLKEKADGNIISKRRYLIPLTNPSYDNISTSASFSTSLLIELDEFYGPFSPLLMAEVEFQSIEEANSFCAPDWFGDDVTNCPEYHNSNMSRKNF